MNIHVTDCLLNNDNLSHKTMKKINVYANDKFQKPKKYFHRDRLPEKYTFKLSSEYLIIQKIKSCSKGLSGCLLPCFHCQLGLAEAQAYRHVIRGIFNTAHIDDHLP